MGRIDVFTARSGEGWGLTCQHLLLVKQTRKRRSILFLMNDIYLGSVYVGSEPSLDCSSCVLSEPEGAPGRDLTEPGPSRCQNTGRFRSHSLTLANCRARVRALGSRLLLQFEPGPPSIDTSRCPRLYRVRDRLDSPKRS